MSPTSLHPNEQSSTVLLEEDLRAYLATRGDLSGRIGPFSPVELIQFLQLSGKQGELRMIVSAEVQAQCTVTASGVVEVRFGHLKGEEAALALLSLHSGWFVFEHRNETPVVRDLLNLNALLMEAVRLEDELDRRAEHGVDLHAPLKLQEGVAAPQDEVNCGVAMVYSTIGQQPGISCAELEHELSLAPLKVRLAVTYLAEVGALRRSTGNSGATPVLVPNEVTWWRQALHAFNGGLRVLVGLPLRGCPVGVTAALQRLADEIDAQLPAVNFSSAGPTFARLHAANGGILSLTFLPEVRKHRFLFETFVDSVDVVLLCKPEAEETQEWLKLVPASVDLCSMGDGCTGACELDERLRRLVMKIAKEKG